MHGPCQLCRLYQGECWGEKVPTHTSLKQHIHFFSLRQELVCVQEKDLTHTLHMAQSSKLLMHFLLPQIGYRYLHWKCVWEREREKYRHRQAQRMHPPTPPPPQHATRVCIGDSVCTLYVLSVGVCVQAEGGDRATLTALTASITLWGASAHLTALGQENTKLGLIAFPPWKTSTNTLSSIWRHATVSSGVHFQSAFIKGSCVIHT